MAKDPTKSARKSTAKRPSKSAGNRSSTRSSRSAKRAATSTKSTGTSLEQSDATTAPATVRLRLKRSISRGGRVFGPGDVDVPAALAESLKLNGAQEL